MRGRGAIRRRRPVLPCERCEIEILANGDTPFARGRRQEDDARAGREHRLERRQQVAFAVFENRRAGTIRTSLVVCTAARPAGYSGDDYGSGPIGDGLQNRVDALPVISGKEREFLGMTIARAPAADSRSASRA